MAYTTAAEIEADFKDMTFTSTSNVKTDDVTQFIVEADALINAYVGARYTVPVTSGDGLNLLKLLSRSLVAQRVKALLEVKQDTSKDANQSVKGVLLSAKEVMAILSDIKNDILQLSGAASLVSSSGFYSNNVANCVKPVVTKSDKQW